MEETIKIILWGMTVGYLIWDRTAKRAVFEYEPDFIKSGLEISPLLMPLSSPRSKGGQWYGERSNLYQGLPPAFADSLPDKWGETLFEKWCATHNVSMKKASPLEHLVFIGKRGMGALEYEPAMELGSNAYFDVDIEELYSFSKQYVSQIEKIHFSTEQDLLWQDLVKVSSSPGGKHPKALVAIDNAGNVISGQSTVPKGFTHYIVKYDSGDGYPYAKLEYVFYKIAVNAGIAMTHSELRKFGATCHFITQRFDRTGNQKHHLQTLAALEPLADSYEEAFSVMRKLNCSEADFAQLFRVMTFNVICGNVDDHNKNISFIMKQDGKWRLAPAYDMTFCIDFNTLPLFNRHELTVCGKNTQITKEDLLSIARQNDIDNAENLLEQLCMAASDFKTIAAEVELPTDLCNKIAQYIERNIIE